MDNLQEHNYCIKLTLSQDVSVKCETSISLVKIRRRKQEKYNYLHEMEFIWGI
jgi:hypothetical protein